jgi:hypothetical protein
MDESVGELASGRATDIHRSHSSLSCRGNCTCKAFYYLQLLTYSLFPSSSLRRADLQLTQQFAALSARDAINENACEGMSGLAADDFAAKRTAHVYESAIVIYRRAALEPTPPTWYKSDMRDCIFFCAVCGLLQYISTPKKPHEVLLMILNLGYFFILNASEGCLFPCTDFVAREVDRYCIRKGNLYSYILIPGEICDPINWTIFNGFITWLSRQNLLFM